MVKKKHQESAIQSFIKSEVYKAFNKHPNRTFNYKQLLRIVKPELSVFAESQSGADIETLNENLKTDILFILAELQEKGELLEVDYGKFKLKPTHAYMEGIIDITSGGAAYI